MNQIDIWFVSRYRKPVQETRFKKVTELRPAIAAFVAAYNPNVKPFR